MDIDSHLHAAQGYQKIQLKNGLKIEITTHDDYTFSDSCQNAWFQSSPLPMTS
jgi:hypothetical protein